jgi:hypothetical protein
VLIQFSKISGKDIRIIKCDDGGEAMSKRKVLTGLIIKMGKKLRSLDMILHNAIVWLRWHFTL